MIKRLCYNKDMFKKGRKQGFTLVELSLAVGFIALLSLTVTLIINDTVATYRRGLTLNNINTTGMDLVDDIRSAIQGSPSRAATFECASLYPANPDSRRECEDDQASKLIVLQREVLVPIDGEDKTIPIYGAVCTGAVSYLWNSGYYFDGDSTTIDEEAYPMARLIYSQATTDAAGNPTSQPVTVDDFRFIQVKDNRRAVCKTALRASIAGGNLHEYRNYGSFNYAEQLTNEFDITNNTADIDFFDGQPLSAEDIETILKNDTSNPLALYDFTLTPPAVNQANKAAFYSASFVLGTIQGGLNVTAKGNFCKTPADYDNDFDYCAINKFNFAAQATGG